MYIVTLAPLKMNLLMKDSAGENSIRKQYFGLKKKQRKLRSVEIIGWLNLAAPNFTHECKLYFLGIFLYFLCFQNVQNCYQV